jgi:hypothetical protein
MASAGAKVSGIPQIRNRFKRAQFFAQTGMLEKLEEIADRTLESIQKKTPRSADIVNLHAADGWFIKKFGGGAKGRESFLAVIDHPWNENKVKQTRTPAEGGPTRTVVVNDGDHSLLATLEFGSKPHLIRARTALNVRGRGRKRPGLTFKIDGKWITVQEVDHPGTKAHAMVRVSVALANRSVKRMITTILKGIRKIGEG